MVRPVILALPILALILATPTAASAHDPLPKLTKNLASCLGTSGSAGWGKITKTAPLGTFKGEAVHQAWMEKKNKRVVFIGDHEDRCTAYPIGRAIAGSYGKFDGGDRLRAFLAPHNEGHCDFDACASVVVIRNDKKDFLYASRTPAACDPAEATTVDLFGDRQSIALTCSSPAGGEDYVQSTAIYHVVGKELKPVLELHKGYSEGMPEGKTVCRNETAGSFKVVKKGKAPVIEAFVPDEDSGDPAAPGELVTFAWDASKKAFTKQSAKPHTLTKALKKTCK